MNFLTFAFCVLAAPWQPANGLVQVSLWPDPPPNSKPSKKSELFEKNSVTEVSQPTFTIYPAKRKRSDAAILVIPGGAFRFLAIELEGTEACDWITSRGLTCVLLKYRVSGSENMALQDTQRALLLLRHRSKEYGISPNRIGVLGFSAGGYLAAAVSTATKLTYTAVDEADKARLHPNFAMLLYPGLLSTKDKNGAPRLNPNLEISKDTPPTFLVHAVNDPTTPIENSQVYYEALRKAKVPVEMQSYPEGGHGFGLRPTNLPISKWPKLAETWLREIKIFEN